MAPRTTGQHNRLQEATTDMGGGITQIEAHGYTAELDSRGRVLRMTSLGYGANSLYSLQSKIGAKEIRDYGEFCNLVSDKSEEIISTNWAKHK